MLSIRTASFLGLLAFPAWLYRIHTSLALGSDERRPLWLPHGSVSETKRPPHEAQRRGRRSDLPGHVVAGDDQALRQRREHAGAYRRSPAEGTRAGRARAARS